MFSTKENKKESTTGRKCLTMDIIKHELGFVPGNLRWALRATQTGNQQHRILGQFTDAEFLVEARKRGFILIKGNEI